MLETLSQLQGKTTNGRVTLSEGKGLKEDAGHSVLDIISKAQLDRLCKMHNDGKDFTDDKALCDKFCKYYDLEPKDKSKVKSKVMKDYGAEIKARCKELSSKNISESEERPYVCVHAKKGKYECKASSSYGAAKKAAEHWGLKSTAGIDAYLADVEHTAVNESLSLKSMFEKLSAELLSENNQVTMQPAQQNTQIIKRGEQVVGTVSNPNLASQLKRGIESGEVSLDQEMNEESADESMSSAQARSMIEKVKKSLIDRWDTKGGYEDFGDKEIGMLRDKLGFNPYGSPEERQVARMIQDFEEWAMNYDGHSMNEADRPSDDADLGAGLGAGRSQVSLEDEESEKSLQDLSDEEFIAMLKGELQKDKTVPSPKMESKKPHKTLKEGMSQRLMAARFEGQAHGLKGHAYHGKSYEDMEEAKAYHEGYKQGIDECYGMKKESYHASSDGQINEGTGQGIAMELEEIAEQIEMLTDQALSILPNGSTIKERARVYWYGHIMQALGSDSYGRSFSTSLRDTIEEVQDPEEYDDGEDFSEDAALEGNAFTAALANTEKGEEFEVGGKTFKNRTDVGEDFAFEAWDRELQDLLNEGKSTSINEGLSVSISKGQEGMPDSVSVTAQDAEAEELLSLIKGLGGNLFGPVTQEPEQHAEVPHSADMPDLENIEVVDDHDDMLSLMRKMSGGDDMMDQESSCNTCEDESEDQMEFEVAEDNHPDSGAEDSVADEDAEAQEDQALAGAMSGKETEFNEGSDDIDPELLDKDGKPLDMNDDEWADYEHSKKKSEPVNEWANDAGKKGTDEAFEQDIDFMTKVISGGLNKQKQDQTTLPHTKVKVEGESPDDWKKLAGIK